MKTESHEFNMAEFVELMLEKNSIDAKIQEFTAKSEELCNKINSSKEAFSASLRNAMKMTWEKINQNEKIDCERLVRLCECDRRGIFTFLAMNAFMGYVHVGNIKISEKEMVVACSHENKVFNLYLPTTLLSLSNDVKELSNGILDICNDTISELARKYGVKDKITETKQMEYPPTDFV